MAREAGIDFDNANMALIVPSHLQSFFALSYHRGARDEREACAKVCDAEDQKNTIYRVNMNAAGNCATAIRSRNNKDNQE